MLAAAYPQLVLDDDGKWLVIPEFRLPAGWHPALTTVMIEPPPNYPEAAPDGFFMAARLQRRGAGGLRTPGHYFDRHKNPHLERNFWWYCLEDQGRHWSPRYDSLLTFVEAIRTYLGTTD